MYKPSESISTISFSNKGSRYLCSGGTGQIVRIWDLQNKRCVKWLKGHTDTITGAVYNCKDEHIASSSRKGDIILHNLASGTKAAELRDPNGQVAYTVLSAHATANPLNIFLAMLTTIFVLKHYKTRFFVDLIILG